MPENAERAVRLETLAGVAVIQPFRAGATAIGRRQFRRLVNAGPLTDYSIAGREDPAANALTEELAFYGGSFLTLPGANGESMFISRHLVRALFLDPEPWTHPSFRDQAFALTGAILALSDAVARRAGLSRGIEPSSPAFRDVVVPSRRRLDRLKHAVTFDRESYAAVLAAHGLTASALDPLTIPLDEPTVTTGDAVADPVQVRPIVAVGDQRIVALPAMLLVAARHALLCLAQRFGVVDDLARRYHAAVLATVHEELEGMSLPFLGLPINPSVTPCATDAVYRLDNDKDLHILLVTDDCAAYDPHRVYSAWPAETLGAWIEGHLRSVRDHIFGTPNPPRGLLSLVLLQGVGRLAMIRFDGSDAKDAPILVMSAADLQTIALLEREDPLALWAYANAARDVRTRAEVVSGEPLDEFYGYRALDYAYPHIENASDGPGPHGRALLPMPLYGAGELRREVLRARDWHGVPFNGGIVEVTTMYDTPAQPIYTPRGADRGQIMVLVEGLPLPFWIVSPTFDVDVDHDERTRALARRYLPFCDIVAYYIWQCTPSLRPLIDRLTPTHDCLYVLLHLPSDAWDARDQGALWSDAPIEDALSVHTDTEHGLMTLTISPGIAASIERPDNNGERLVMRHVLRGLGVMVGDVTPERDAASDEVIERMLEHHAPLGLKKRLSAIGNLSLPDLDPRSVPRARPIHRPTAQFLRHELRAYLHATTSSLGACASREEVVALRNRMVSFSYHALEEFVASLDPDGLVESLVAQHEALTLQRAQNRLSIPTLALALADVPELFEKEQATLNALAHAAVAARFAIEYVAARPPAGHIPISLGSYDRLLALAAQIIELGAESDLIQYGLIDIGTEPLSPRALFDRRAPYARAAEAYAGVYAAGETARMTQAFASHWPDTERGRDDGSGLLALVDDATRAEWGLSLMDISLCLGALGDIGRVIDPGVARLSLDDVHAALVDALSWPRTRVERALDLLSLGPRPDFMDPPTGYTKTEVYPWRYNRALSFLRRPLIRCERDGATEIVWGPRHLYSAQRYLVTLVLDGRVEATTVAMRRLRSAVVHRRGEAFNDAVVNLLREDPALVVSPRVELDASLGDIDVLMADPARQRLWVIECKAITPGRMPHEVATEARKLFDERGGKLSAVEKHRRREADVRGRPSRALARLGLPPDEGWTVEALIVVDQELFTPYLRRSPVRVVPLDHLRSLIASPGTPMGSMDTHGGSGVDRPLVAPSSPVL